MAKKWQKLINKKALNSTEYKWTNGKYTINVSMWDERGLPASNKIQVMMDGYGGWILTEMPDTFSSRKECIHVVSLMKKKLDKDDYGTRIPFTEY